MKRAFTLLEVVIVIVIMGIMSKFGAEMMMQAYENYLFSTYQNRLQVNSEAALVQITNRLQHRIKASTIARNGAGFVAVGQAAGASYSVLEWIGKDIGGWYGINNGAGFNQPTWSGVIDLDRSSATQLISPMTSGANVNQIIKRESSNTISSVSPYAIFFVDDTLNINTFGWNGGAVGSQQNVAAHRVRIAGNVITSVVGNFSRVSEYYELAYTAFAVVVDDPNAGDLSLYYNYQPWNGETYGNDGTRVLLMENVDSFKFVSSGDMLKIQVCVDDNNIFSGGKYAVCKEKTVY